MTLQMIEAHAPRWRPLCNAPRDMHSPQLTIRITQSTLGELDRIAGEMREREPGANLSRSDAARMAIERGLRAIRGESK